MVSGDVCFGQRRLVGFSSDREVSVIDLEDGASGSLRDAVALLQQFRQVHGQSVGGNSLYHNDMKRTFVDWQEVELVMLDMDGTVLDLAFDNFFWSELLPQRYAERNHVDRAAAWAYLEPIFAAERGQLSWYCLDFWSAITGLDLVALKTEIRERIAPLPGSIDFLEAVRSSGRQLWLVTNAHPDSWRLKMTYTGLHRHFNRTVCAHDYGAPKEQAQFWQRLANRYPFDPRRVLFVDDSISVLSAARSHGLAQVIGVECPDSSLPARRLTDFPSISGLEALLPLGRFD